MLTGSVETHPIPVFPWHSLVPYLTNTQPTPAETAPEQPADGSTEQPEKAAGAENRDDEEVGDESGEHFSDGEIVS